MRRASASDPPPPPSPGASGASATVSGPGPVRSPELAREWKCPHCDAINEIPLFAPRSDAAAAAMPPQPAAADACFLCGTGLPRWTCALCEWQNPLAATCCAFCAHPVGEAPFGGAPTQARATPLPDAARGSRPAALAISSPHAAATKQDALPASAASESPVQPVAAAAPQETQPPQHRGAAAAGSPSLGPAATGPPASDPTAEWHDWAIEAVRREEASALVRIRSAIRLSPLSPLVSRCKRWVAQKPVLWGAGHTKACAVGPAM